MTLKHVPLTRPPTPYVVLTTCIQMVHKDLSCTHLHCCHRNPFWDKSLGYGVAFGGLFVVIVILVVIVSCCLYHRALRRKRSRLRELQQQRAGRRCSSVTVTQSLPPSYGEADSDGSMVYCYDFVLKQIS